MPHSRKEYGVKHLTGSLSLLCTNRMITNFFQVIPNVSTLSPDVGISDLIGCSSGFFKTDPLIHKSTYRVGVYAAEGHETATLQFNLTFAEYLTATAGKRFDPPIAFEMMPANLHELFDAAEEEEIDFVFSSPGVYSCMGAEKGAEPLATVISRLEVRGHTYDLGT